MRALLDTHAMYWYHHKDPFDRLLVAQSLAEQIPIIGNDAAFDAYGVARLW